MQQPKLGIVIPVSKGEKRLGDTLYYLEQRTTLPYKVVVCSTHEGEYEDICKTHNADLIITRTSLGEAKNLGAAHMIDCDILVFMDAHVKVDPGWDTEIVNILSDKSVGITTLYTYTLSPDFKVEHRWQGGAGFKFNYDMKREWCGVARNGEVEWVNGAFQAFRRNAFWMMGGFKLGYRNVCGNGKVGHVFKVGKTTLPYHPINDFHYGDLLIAYLYFPHEEYERIKSNRNFSPALVRYIEANFEKMKKYLDDNAGRGPQEEDAVLWMKSGYSSSATITIPSTSIHAHTPALGECVFPRILAGMLTPRIDTGKVFYRVRCIMDMWGVI